MKTVTDSTTDAATMSYSVHAGHSRLSTSVKIRAANGILISWTDASAKTVAAADNRANTAIKPTSTTMAENWSAEISRKPLTAANRRLH